MDLKKIRSVEVEGVDPNDYPDFCDAYIASAEWDDGTPLTEAELDELNFEHRDFVYDHVKDWGHPYEDFTYDD